MRIEQFASLHEGPLLLLKATPTRVLILAIAYEPLFFIIHFICSFCFLSLLYLFTSLFVPIRLLFLCLSMSTNAPTLLLLLFLFHQKTIYYFPYIHAVISLRFVYLRRPLFFPFSSFSPSDKQTQGRPRVPTRAGHPLRASLQLETATQAPFTLAQLTQWLTGGGVSDCHNLLSLGTLCGVNFMLNDVIIIRVYAVTRI